MIYPSYRVLDSAGNERTFYWFCFARLQYLDRQPHEYHEYLNDSHRGPNKMPFWDYKEDSLVEPGAGNVVRIEVALYIPDWDQEVVKEVLKLPLFDGLSSEFRNDFLVVGINTTGKYITEIMYPLFFIRNILSTKETFDILYEKGLSIQEAAILGSQFETSTRYSGRFSMNHVGDDYQLAQTFKGLAMLLKKSPTYHGDTWGDDPSGYGGLEQTFCDLPEEAFGEGVDWSNIYGVIDFLDELDDPHTDYHQVMVDYFKEAMEKLDEKV